MQEVQPEEIEKPGSNNMLKNISMIVVAIILCFAGMALYVNALRKKRRKERLRRKREARRRAELAEQEARMATRRHSGKVRSAGTYYDAVQSRNKKHPVNRNNQDIHRRPSGNQNMPRDRRPRNRRFD